MNMNTCLPAIMMAAFLAATGFQPAEATDRSRPEQRRPPPREMRTGAADTDADRAIERWMNMLERRNPEEHARLAQLRQEDPDAFRTVLRQRLADLRRAHQARGEPRAAPESRRQERRPTRGADPRRWTREERSDPRLEDIEQRLAELTRRYQAASPTERAGIREEMHTVLAEWADVQFELSEEHIRRMEEQLQRLRESLEDRRGRRDAMIQRRLNALIEGM